VTSDSDLERIYGHRFGDADDAAKDGVWTEIGAYLQRWIERGDRVLDIACDAGYFIRHVRAAERWAVDVRDKREALGPDITFRRVDGRALTTAVPSGYFDVVFTSNFLEHLPSADAVIAMLGQAHAVLRPGGRLIILQPNIRYVGAAYWDFIDHRTALTEHSLVEAARAAGFEVERLIPRFLPYTTKSRLPRAPWLVRLYLRTPLAWRVMGKQTLLVGRAVARPERRPIQAPPADEQVGNADAGDARSPIAGAVAAGAR
jgi:SAM-dependent methyltransferase